MRKALSIATLGVLMWGHGGVCLSAVNPRTPSDAFEAGTAAFAREDFDAALAFFESALAAGLDGPAVHYNIGVCRYKLGRYAESREAFALISERYPEMRGLAEYNLGLVALKQDDARRAERHFSAALEESDDETIRYLAAEQLDRRQSLGARPSAQRPSPQELVIVDGQVGYDDNVLLLADEIALPDGQSAESSFLELWGMLSRPIGESGFRFDASMYALQYPDASMFDQSVLQIGSPYEWTFGSWRGEAVPQMSWTTIAGDVLDRRVAFGMTAEREIAPETTLEFRYFHDEIREGDSQYEFFAGDRDALEVRLDRRGERGRITLSHAVESNDREADAVSPRRSKWSVRYSYDLSTDWLIDMRASRRESRYSRLADPRQEELKELELGMTRVLPEGWLVNATVAAGDNDSEVETVSYRRKRISVGATKQF